VTVLFRQVDDSSRGDHHYLDEGDQVYFLREYTSRKGWQHGETNSLISNLKKTMDLAGTSQWPYKARAIAQCAAELRRNVNPLRDLTWVPTPPSKAPSDPLYDDRLVQILRQAFPQGDVRELVVQRASTTAVHVTSASRPTPAQLSAGYEVDGQLGPPKPAVIVFDDILTTGSHFKAMQLTLGQAFPDVEIYGLVIARRIFPDDDEGAGSDTRTPLP